MLIHSIMPASRANGPGVRAVVWFQGCLLRCPGCHNPNTHPFRGDAMTPKQICHLIWDAAPGMDGLTVSGGEPMNQAEAVLQLFETFREYWPIGGTRKRDIGMFTGYNEWELEMGKYVCSTFPPLPVVRAHRQRAQLWSRIREHLSWAVFGRYDRTQPSTLPMRASANQVLRLYTNDQTEADFGDQQLLEFNISETGLVQVTGFEP